MALAEAPVRNAPKGKERPRIAPPVPARSDVKVFEQVATDIGITLMPWQRCAGRYIEATGPEGRHLYREVAIVAARQNGKSTLLVALIVKWLREGKRVIHTAQNRELPREVFGQVADILADDQTLFPERNGRRTRPRFANGQEEIRLANGGLYRIVAPTRGGARGHAGIDRVIIDELREMDTWDFVAAAKPTTTASPDPQIIYLSNAGEEDSVVLNALRDRAGKDEALAYLEWSAAPDRAADDLEGWTEANPAIGHMPAVLETLRDEYRAASLSGTLALFEVEHLCRWVKSTRQALVEIAAWNLCAADELARAKRPVMGIAMDPGGTRASASLSWLQADGTVALRSLLEARGDPIDVQALGEDLRALAVSNRVREVAFDPMTDGELAKYFRVTHRVTGQEFANASAQFVNLVDAGKLRWQECSAVGDDLTWTARKSNDETGTFVAVRANDDRPITAALASIRAVWRASGPRPPAARIY